MFRSYYVAKILHKMQIPSFHHCRIDKTARLSSGCALARVEMGRYTYAGSDTNITDARIGSFCSIGDSCRIGGGLHPMTTVSTSPVFLQGRNIMGRNFAQIPYEPSRTVTIGHDVWIGDQVFIKAGVTIGDGAVIGAHAVVVRDVAPYTVVAGVPAKEIRKRFDQKTVDRLLALKWWDWPEADLKRYGASFSSPEALDAAVAGEKP